MVQGSCEGFKPIYNREEDIDVYSPRRKGEERNGMLTKYVVGANAKPPKNPSSPPKKGKVMAMNIVNAAYEITQKNRIRNGFFCA